jgi:hypothetical protein
VPPRWPGGFCTKKEPRKAIETVQMQSMLGGWKDMMI